VCKKRNVRREFMSSRIITLIIGLLIVGSYLMEHSSSSLEREETAGAIIKEITMAAGDCQTPAELQRWLRLDLKLMKEYGQDKSRLGECLQSKLGLLSFSNAHISVMTFEQMKKEIRALLEVKRKT
jgi:hypothetical protein